MKALTRISPLLLISVLLLLAGGCNKEPKSIDYGSKLPGTFVAEVNAFQRRLLSENEQGYLVQDFYGYHHYTSPFIIKNKEDLTLGMSAFDRFANVYDRIPSIDGPIEQFWLDPFGQKQGELILKGQYQQGKRVGRWQIYYRSGQLGFEYNYSQGVLEGVQRSWYSTGEPNREYHYHQGIPEGKVTVWYKNGQKVLEKTYKQGVQEGAYHYWYATGKPWIQGQYKKGKAQGTWYYWWADGKLEKKETYQAGTIVKQQIINANDASFQHYYPDTYKYKYYICGSFNGQAIRLGGLYQISYSFEDDKLSKLDYFNRHRRYGCEEKPYLQMKRILIGFSWPDLKSLTDRRYYFDDDRVIFNLANTNGDGGFIVDLNWLEVKTEEEKQQKMYKDPVFGLWRIDKDDGDLILWQNKADHRAKRVITCSAKQDLDIFLCTHIVYFPQYRAFFTIDYLETLLPQWRLIEKQAEQLIYNYTIKS